MKRLIMLGLAIAGLAGFAGTCTIINIRLTSFNAHKTFGGQLKNDSGANLLAHNIRVTFFDSSNNIVESKTTSGCLRSLQTGSSDFFSVQTTDSGSNVVSAISALAYDSTLRAGSTVTGNASISNIQIHRNGTSLIITGTLRNNDATTLTSPVICAVVRDTSGAVLVVAKGSTGDLSQNASSAFSVNVTVPSDSTAVDHVDFWFDGLSAGVPISPLVSTNNSVLVCAATAIPTTTATGTATASQTPTATGTAGTATAIPTANPCS